MNERSCKHVPVNPEAEETACHLCDDLIRLNATTRLWDTITAISARDLVKWIDDHDRAIDALVDAIMEYAYVALRALPIETDVQLGLLRVAARCHESATMSLRTERVKRALLESQNNVATSILHT